MIEHRVITGDCLTVMRGMSDGSVGAVIADPPYGVGLAYNGAFDDSPERWVGLAAPCLAECLRVSAGPVLWFGAASTLERDLAALKPERLLIWAPSFTLAKSRKDGVFFRWHPIHCWRLGLSSTPPDEAQSGIYSDVLTVPCAAARQWWNHPATKPLRLMERMVRIVAPGMTILDPFCGSGTTGVACKRTGRGFVGVELSEEYAAIARKRIGEHDEPTELFAGAANGREAD